MGESVGQPRGDRRRPSFLAVAVMALVLAETAAGQQSSPARVGAGTTAAAGVVAPATAVIGARAQRGPTRGAATTGRVTGTLTDAVTGEWLVGGQVAVRGLPLGNVSDDIGVYFINNVPAGAHTVAVEYLGYEPQAKELDVAAGAEATLDFALQPTAIELQEIVVEEETVRDLSEYVEKAPRPEFDVEPLREVDVARSDTSLMEQWHRDMRDLTVVHAITYPLAGTTVYYRRPKPVKREGDARARERAASADSGESAAAENATSGSTEP